MFELKAGDCRLISFILFILKLKFWFVQIFECFQVENSSSERTRKDPFEMKCFPENSSRSSEMISH